MECDLISREALLERIQSFRDRLRPDIFVADRVENDTLGIVSAVILNLPAVDAVEVVRCKDCVFYQPFIQEMYKGKGDCEEHDAMVCDDDFCSYGRKLVKKDVVD